VNEPTDPSVIGLDEPEGDKTMVVQLHRIGRIAGLLSLIALAACTTPAAPPPGQPVAARPSFTETGGASWYGAELAGAKTASGTIFDPAKPTAAHRSLPFQTVARVTNVENGRSVKVVITDRGPYGKGRIIDVSAKAAQALGLKKDGVMTVKVEVLAEDQIADKTAVR
jgi:rare lipoprotein A